MPLAPLLRDQRKVDSDHLRLLAVFHFIFAGFAFLGIGFLFLHWSLLHAVIDNPDIWKNQKGAPPPKELLALFHWFYVVFGAMLLTSGVLNMVSGVCLRQPKARMFSFVVAALDCLQFPVGTVLGVFTIVVLLRDSVRELYECADPVDSPPRQAVG